MTDIQMQVFEGKGTEWNALVAALPGAHLLQTWEWAQVKAAHGWQPMPFVWRSGAGDAASASYSRLGEASVLAAAMVLRRPVIGRGFVRRLCILYVPKGPLLDSARSDLLTQVLHDLEMLSRLQGAILVKIDPDVELGRGYAGEPVSSENAAGSSWQRLLKERGWRFSEEQIQFRNSIWIDLAASTEELLRRMKQKARYNIRLAERKGVRVRAGSLDDLAELYSMYSETADRDGFVIRSKDYYHNVWRSFLGAEKGGPQPSAEALVAEVEGKPVAALWLFHFAQRAYYLYGMSRADHREKMPNYLLQWEAIQRAQLLGCRTYDLWGAPERFVESDPMWGVFRFKEGLGGQVVRTIGAWDYPSGGIWYRIYSQLVPRVLDVMRWRGRKRNHQALGGS